MNNKNAEGKMLVLRIDAVLTRKLDDEQKRMSLITKRKVKTSSCVRRLLELALTVDRERRDVMVKPVAQTRAVEAQQVDAVVVSEKPKVSTKAMSRLAREKRRAELEKLFTRHARQARLTTQAFIALARAIDTGLEPRDLALWYNRAVLPAKPVMADRLLDAVHAIVRGTG